MEKILAFLAEPAPKDPEQSGGNQNEPVCGENYYSVLTLVFYGNDIKSGLQYMDTQSSKEKTELLGIFAFDDNDLPCLVALPYSENSSHHSYYDKSSYGYKWNNDGTFTINDGRTFTFFNSVHTHWVTFSNGIGLSGADRKVVAWPPINRTIL